MRKILITLLILTVILLLSYSTIWYFTLSTVAKIINNQYANKDITIYQYSTDIGTTDQEKISFSTIKPAGFPFELGLDILNFTNTNITRKISCIHPIKIRYNLMHKNLHINYQGKCHKRLFPLESGFGTNIKLDIILVSKLKSLKNLIKNFKKIKIFELINYIKNYKLILQKYEIYDSINNSLKEQIKPSYFYFSFSDHPYYYSFNDFLTNIPKHYNLDTKITKIVINNNSKIEQPSDSINFELKLTLDTLVSNISTSNNILETILSNSATMVEKCIYEDQFFRTVNKINYKNLTYQNNRDAKFILASSFIPKNKKYLIQLFLDFLQNEQIKQKISDLKSKNLDPKLQNFYSKLPSLTISDNIKTSDSFKKAINEINISDKITLNLDYELKKHQQHVTDKLNNLELFFGKYGVTINYLNQGIITFEDYQGNFSQGTLSLLNFKNIINYMVDLFNIIQSFRQEYKDNTAEENSIISEFNKNVWKSFLVRISDHPNSKSNDLVINYNYDSSKHKDDMTKIGNDLTLIQVKELYYQTLCKEAQEQTEKSSTPGKLVQKLLPQLQKNSDLIDKLNQSPEMITPTLWQDIKKSLRY